MKVLIGFALPAAAILLPSTASAQYLPSNDPAPGFSSILSSDYATAEKEIRGADVSQFDPARTINLGVALAKQGRRDEAAQAFQSVLMGDDVELVVANGKTVMSHDLARYALASLQSGVLSR